MAPTEWLFTDLEVLLRCVQVITRLLRIWGEFCQHISLTANHIVALSLTIVPSNYWRNCCHDCDLLISVTKPANRKKHDCRDDAFHFVLYICPRLRCHRRETGICSSYRLQPRPGHTELICGDINLLRPQRLELPYPITVPATARIVQRCDSNTNELNPR